VRSARLWSFSAARAAGRLAQPLGCIERAVWDLELWPEVVQMPAQPLLIAPKSCRCLGAGCRVRAVRLCGAGLPVHGERQEQRSCAAIVGGIGLVCAAVLVGHVIFPRNTCARLCYIVTGNGISRSLARASA
jgi:hypothetical protein